MFNTKLVLSTLFASYVCASASLAHAQHHSADHNHDHHHHGEAPLALELNNGEKWEIDPPLRKAMGDISEVMRNSMNDIHRGTLPAGEYANIANQVNESIFYMIEKCELPPDADMQLHMVIHQLLEGVDKLNGNHDAAPRDGAVQIVEALDAYAEYFDDPKFEPVTH